jgi:hypothetical protein
MEKAGDGQPASLDGGGEGDRTLDLRIANATLSQLSYSPEKGEDTSSKAWFCQSIGDRLAVPGQV